MKYEFIKGKSAKRATLIRAYNGLIADAKMLKESSYSNEDKLESLNTILNLKKIIENYDELEPVLKKFFKEKHEKEKWER